jgi:hypothetical protein
VTRLDKNKKTSSTSGIEANLHECSCRQYKQQPPSLWVVLVHIIIIALLIMVWR